MMERQSLQIWERTAEFSSEMDFGYAQESFQIQQTLALLSQNSADGLSFAEMKVRSTNELLKCDNLEA